MGYHIVRDWAFVHRMQPWKCADVNVHIRNKAAPFLIKFNDSWKPDSVLCIFGETGGSYLCELRKRNFYLLKTVHEATNQKNTSTMHDTHNIKLHTLLKVSKLE